MNLPLWIARRYFFTRKKQSLIQVLSLISMIGVGLGAMALVVVLSVFNGITDMFRHMYNSFDPELKIEARQGKAFVYTPELRTKLQAVPGVKVLTEVIEDYALLRYRDRQLAVKIWGVSPNFASQGRLSPHIVAGYGNLEEGTRQYAILGEGIRRMMEVDVENQLELIQFWYPKKKRARGLDPTSAFNKLGINAGGSFLIEESFDTKYVFLPLAFVQELTDYGDRRTFLEVQTDGQTSPQVVKQALQEVLGADFAVLDTDEQHQTLFRVLKIEKLVVFLALSLIVVIASFNIFVSLGMMVVEKQKDIALLKTLGASPRLIRQIFLWEGLLIGGVGAVMGLSLGLAVVLAQQQWGLVVMNAEALVPQAYPVRLAWADFVAVTGAVALITLLACWPAAQRAAAVESAR